MYQVSTNKMAPRGMAMLIAIVCVAVAGTVFLAMLTTAAARRQTAQTDAWRIQASWLAESAVSRAAAQLAADESYTGETFRLSAEELGGRDSGVVQIEVEVPSDQATLRRVTVRADYPDDPHRRARCRKQVVITVPSQSRESK